MLTSALGLYPVIPSFSIAERDTVLEYPGERFEPGSLDRGFEGGVHLTHQEADDGRKAVGAAGLLDKLSNFGAEVVGGVAGEVATVAAVFTVGAAAPSLLGTLLPVAPSFLSVLGSAAPSLTTGALIEQEI